MRLFHELRDLAAANNVCCLYEATVTPTLAAAASAGASVGDAPIFSLFREALPAARLMRFRGILNSAAQLILTEMVHGNAFDAGVKKAQNLSIAETDPSFDVDGWDAKVKVSALATVLTLAPTLAAGASVGVDYPLNPIEALQNRPRRQY